MAHILGYFHMHFKHLNSYLRDHIHPHGITSLGMEADVEISPSQSNQQLLEPCKPANSNHTLFHTKTTC